MKLFLSVEGLNILGDSRRVIGEALKGNKIEEWSVLVRFISRRF